MSCSLRSQLDWRVLVGDQPSAAVDDERERLREHARECPSCLRRAIELDSTFAFQHLPEASPAATEVEAMRQRVAGSLRLLEAADAEADGGRAKDAKEGVPAPARAAIAAAVGAAVIGALALAGAWIEPSAGPAASGVTAPVLALDEAPADYAHLRALPLVDAVSVVHQASGQGYDVVELVAAELDLNGP